MAEHKIGEIFKYNGEWYQCVKGNTCNDCAFYRSSCGSLNGKGSCRYNFREDATNVIFKKLEKIGKPYEHYEKFYQCYKLPMETEIRLLPNNCYPIGKDNLVEIEIKQKEDMEGKKIQHYDCFFNGKSSKSNLKPFDLKAAKAGKTVCTRDGRKARIICFDRKGDMSITALITNKAIDNDNKVSEIEEVHFYYENGSCNEYQEYRYDLMMLPEKKEGWINIYNADTTFYYVDGRVFDTKDEAVKEAKEEIEKEQREKNEYIDTIRVEWEE